MEVDGTARRPICRPSRALRETSRTGRGRRAAFHAHGRPGISYSPPGRKAIAVSQDPEEAKATRLFISQPGAARTARRLFGCGEAVARERFFTSAGVLGQDAQKVGRARGQLGNGLARDTEPIQHLLRATERRQRSAHQLFELDELLAADGNAAAAESLLGGASRGGLCRSARRQRRRDRRVHRARSRPSSPGRVICSIERAAEDAVCLRERQRARCELVLIAALALRDDAHNRIAPGLARRDEEHLRWPAVLERPLIERLALAREHVAGGSAEEGAVSFELGYGRRGLLRIADSRTARLVFDEIAAPAGRVLEHRVWLQPTTLERGAGSGEFVERQIEVSPRTQRSALGTFAGVFPSCETRPMKTSFSVTS